MTDGLELTPEEFRDKFLASTPDEQVRIAEVVLNSGRRASRCFTMDHDGLEAQMRFLSGVLYDASGQIARYRAAWCSARRRARGGDR